MERTITVVTTMCSVSLIVHSAPRTWSAEYGAIASPMRPIPASRNAAKRNARFRATVSRITPIPNATSRTS
jgi:hypothetical protein